MRSRPARLLIALAVSVSLWSVANPGTSHAQGPIRVTGTYHGLRLTLSIPRPAYPRDALIRIQTRLQNVSHRTIWIWDGGPPAPGKYTPQPSVYDATGTTALPISLTESFPYPGPGPSISPLKPGVDRTTSELIVLRGPDVRLGVTLAGGHHGDEGSGKDVFTPMAHVALTPPDTARVVPAPTANDPLRMDIEPPAGAKGPLLSVYYTNCGDTHFDQNIWWTQIARHVSPTCTPVHVWHVLAGWLNHSIVTIDYSVPGASPESQKHLRTERRDC